MTERNWYSAVSRHVFRLFFAVRDLEDSELNDIDRKLRDKAQSVFSKLTEDEQDICKRFYHYNRTPAQIEKDLLIPENDCYRAIRKAEKRLAQELGLISPD